MRSRLPVAALALTMGIALSTEPTLRALSLIVAITTLCAAAIVRPSVRVRELLVATTVAIGCLSSFASALIAVVVSLLTLIFWSRGHRPASEPQRARRFLAAVPLAVITIGVLVAIGFGDRRLDPVEAQSNATATPQRPGLPDLTNSEPSVGVSIDTLRDRGLAIETGRSTQLDAQRIASDSYLDRSATDYYRSPGEVQWTTELSELGRSGGPGDESTDRLPWLLALVAFLIGVYSLVASRRFGRTPIAVAVASATSGLTPLDWYDRIVEQAGHQRNPSNPVLRHSRRVADETGDKRFRELGRIVSDHLYSGRSLTEADLELIGRLNDDDNNG